MGTAIGSIGAQILAFPWLTSRPINLGRISFMIASVSPLDVAEHAAAGKSVDVAFAKSATGSSVPCTPFAEGLSTGVGSSEAQQFL